MSELNRIQIKEITQSKEPVFSEYDSENEEDIIDYDMVNYIDTYKQTVVIFDAIKSVKSDLPLFDKLRFGDLFEFLYPDEAEDERYNF
jgi:hypothetical protein